MLYRYEMNAIRWVVSAARSPGTAAVAPAAGAAAVGAALGGLGGEGLVPAAGPGGQCHGGGEQAGEQHPEQRAVREHGWLLGTVPPYG